ncbi:UNVERIFIED_CONTAM: hypothetical protein FKN15_020700 [Acipenser sinensis]
MTAARGTGVDHAMRSQEPWRLAQPSPTHQRLLRFGCRSKREPSIKGKLRIKSPPGAFLILGVFVVLVGMTVAVAGYWPHRGQRGGSVSHAGGGLNDSRPSRRVVGGRTILSTPHLLHHNRMKLLGPVIMGVGLFIVICANTMLYENRDKETQLLLTQEMICSIKATGLFDNQDNTGSRHYQWMTNLSSADLNIRCLEELVGSDCLCLQTQPNHGGKWVDCYQPDCLQTKVQLLHHKEPSPTLSLCSVHSDSCNSSKGNINVLSCQTVETAGFSSSTNTPSLPVIKLNNQLIEAGLSISAAAEQCASPEEPTGSTFSSGRTSDGGGLAGGHSMAAGPNVDPFSRGEIFVQDPCRKEFSSDVCLNLAGHSNSLDLGRGGVQLGAPLEERKNRSWPRLDLCNMKRYIKLESHEDSLEKLLDQLEHQYSQWEKNYTGPYQ